MTKIIAFALSLVLASFNLHADTTDAKWKNIIELTKTGEHCKDDENCFNRYHPAIEPKATAKPGDIIVLHTRAALDSNYSFDAVAEEFPVGIPSNQNIFTPEGTRHVSLRRRQSHTGVTT